MGLWKNLVTFFCGEPQKQVAGEEELRREHELLQAGLWGKALGLCDTFIFAATAERFAAWYRIARQHKRCADEAFDSGFMGRVINLLQSMAARLDDDTIWCQTASITLAGTRCYSGGSYVCAAIRAAARVANQDKRAQCMREIAGRLQNPYCAMDAAEAEMALYPYLTPDERQAVHGKLLLSQHRQQGEARIAQVAGEPVTYSAENYKEAIRYGQNFRFFAREFKEAYPEEWPSLLLEHWRQCFEGDGVCTEVMDLCTDEQLQLLSERLEEEIRAKPWWEDLRLWRIALAAERRRRS